MTRTNQRSWWWAERMQYTAGLGGGLAMAHWWIHDSWAGWLGVALFLIGSVAAPLFRDRS